MTTNRFKCRLVTGALFLVTLFTTAAPRLVRADSQEFYGIVVSMNGPTNSSRGISWYAATPSLDSNVLVRPQGSTSWESATLFTGEAAVHNLQVDNSLVRKDYYIHKVVVNGLSSATEYEYKVGNQTHNLWSEVGTFKTSDESSNKVSFMVTTDVHYGASENPGYRFYENAIKSAYQVNPHLDFLVMSGDLVNQWSDELYTYVYKEEEWLDAYTSNPYLMKTSFVHSAGNHDINEKNSDFDYSLFNHYALTSGAGLETKHGVTFAFDYANGHFVVWNNPDTDYVYSAAQLAWLDADLGATEKEWKVILTHVPLFEGQLNYESEVLTILEKHNVDIVFAGHRHYYMRTKPMKNKVPIESVTINESVGFVKKIYTLENEGIVHTTNSSTGGASAWRIHNGALSSNTASYFGLNSVLPGVGTVERGNGMYSLVTLDDNELTVDVYFRKTTAPTAPFNLLESYGNRKDYYKSLNRAIEELPANSELTVSDLEALLTIRKNLEKYQTSFPSLALNVKTDNITKLNAAIDYSLNPPETVKPLDPELAVPKSYVGLYVGLGGAALLVPLAVFLVFYIIKKRRKTSIK